LRAAREALDVAAGELAEAGCPSPRVDAEWLLAEALSVSRSELQADGTRELSPEIADAFRRAIARRAAREPLAYILGAWGFRRLELRVDRRVLIPRPETEVLVERSLALIAGIDRPRVLDIGVGSGAVALAIADEHAGAQVVATEHSTGALAVAEENRERLGLGDRVELIDGELFAGLAGPFDLVVSNPPYVEPAELDTLDPEVRDHEPREALVATGVTEAITARGHEVLVAGGALALEVADGKAVEVAVAFKESGYEGVTVTKDLAGRERIVDGRTRR
jgi:release factor glutamine methyltransferase